MSISSPISHPQLCTKIISIIRYCPQNSCHPSPHPPQIPPIKMTTNNLHEANEVGACWYMGDTLLACKLIERKEILLGMIIRLSIL